MPANQKTHDAKRLADSAPACCGILPPLPAGDYSSRRELFNQRATILKAMAHPARLFIVDRLSAGECTVRELTELIGCEMPTVSRHLSVLRHAGIVESRKQGSNVWYRLQVPCILNFFGCIEEVLQHDPVSSGKPAGDEE